MRQANALTTTTTARTRAPHTHSVLGAVVEGDEWKSARSLRPAPLIAPSPADEFVEAPLRSPFRNKDGTPKAAALDAPQYVRQPSLLPRRKRKGSVPMEDIQHARTSLLGPLAEGDEAAAAASARNLLARTRPGPAGPPLSGRQLFAAGNGVGTIQLPTKPVVGKARCVASRCAVVCVVCCGVGAELTRFMYAARWCFVWHRVCVCGTQGQVCRCSVSACCSPAPWRPRGAGKVGDSVLTGPCRCRVCPPRCAGALVAAPRASTPASTHPRRRA